MCESGDPDLLKRHHDMESRRFSELGFVPALLERSGRLRPSLSLAEVHDVLWAMGSPDWYIQLVYQRGWTPSRYEAWLGDAMLEVPAGEAITFFLHAPPENQQPHNMAIREGLVVVARSAFLDGGESAVFTVFGLSPGAYRFYCEFEDHLAEGMTGDLTVAP